MLHYQLVFDHHLYIHQLVGYDFGNLKISGTGVGCGRIWCGDKGGHITVQMESMLTIYRRMAIVYYKLDIRAVSCYLVRSKKIGGLQDHVPSL